ncbi:MAG: glycosyltransferase family 2 protein [Leadbetterella sp.]
MKFSILTATYNSSATLEQTIQSVLAQSHKDIEFIIVDGASKDNTLEIIKRYESHLRYISEPDTGIYNALNKGLALATGDIISILGSDDYYPDRDVISSVNTIFETQNVDSVYGDIQYVNYGKEDVIARFWKQEEYKPSLWLKGWMPPHPTFYLKRKHFQTYGNFEEQFVCAGDYELMLRMLYKHNLSSKYLPKTLMTMRNGGTSTGGISNRIRANIEDRRAWEINGLTPKWYTLWWKPLSKVFQRFQKK